MIEDRKQAAYVHDVWLASETFDPETVFTSIQSDAVSNLVALHIVGELSNDGLLLVADLNARLRSAGYAPLLRTANVENVARLHVAGVLGSFQNFSKCQSEQKGRVLMRFLRRVPRLYYTILTKVHVTNWRNVSY